MSRVTIDIEYVKRNLARLELCERLVCQQQGVSLVELATEVGIDKRLVKKLLEWDDRFVIYGGRRGRGHKWRVRYRTRKSK